MHNNFYFLRQLSLVLESRIKNSVISECFSQSKDELIIRFETASVPFLIKASLSPGFSCLSFPETFQRARRNSVDLFQQLIGRHVAGIRQFNNERSFALQTTDGINLLFKMHGNRTNIVLFQDGQANELFRNNLMGDAEIKPANLDREIDWSYENFETHAGNLKGVYFTFGKVVWQYLQEKHFSDQSLTQKWETTQLLLKDLNDPAYYITMIQGTPTLSLLKTGEIRKVWSDPLSAANDFYYTFTHLYAFAMEKARLVSSLQTQLDAGKHYREKNTGKLTELEKDNNYKVWADLVMANLHNIPPRAEKVVVENFYNDNKLTEIKLKKDLNPQKNAELFYKKAKNQHIEIARLRQAVEIKEQENEIIRKKLELVETASDLKSLRAIRSEISPEADTKKQTTPLPYHEFTFNGYTIWVGKNAQANDVLTLKFGYKEDLWLHAKDVAGSHVILKHQAGKNFPKDVIEYAGSLAAFYSKRKNESLCPVIVTPKKYVRKRKGDPAGAVVVDREDVILVQPFTR